VPCRVVVVEHAEIRSADDFEIIGQARMRDCEVVGGEVRTMRHLVDVWRVRIVENLAVAMVFHHDDEHVAEVRNAPRNRSLGGKRGARKSCCE
jgi:hypothetical protein